ncbi:tail protein [Burkholderia arboris]|uniref:Tail protein n=1 Tax=Burkholderia arboris TaxID=488730 RepID=A0A9Q9SGM1_9BURK|nr:phage tail protein [Burkholderia arboris]VWB35333.1 tail protein [Burkholderia arboris]
MANLKEESKWEDGVYQFETSDPVQGGPDGVDNVPTKQLANRTRHLKDRADAADKVVGGLGSGKLDKSGGSMSGALLAKPGAIAGNNPKNVGIAFDGDADTGMFSPSEGYLQLGANGVPYLAMQGDVMSLASPGIMLFNSGDAERARLTRDGRWLFGTATDNGRDGLQVALRASFANGICATGMDVPDGGQVRATSSQYGAMLRVDDFTAYWLQTKKGDSLGSWNDYRPFSWTLGTGAVSIDGTGAGTYFGGSIDMGGDLKVRPASDEGRVYLGQSNGYFFASAGRAGWFSESRGSFQYHFGERVLKVNDKVVWSEGNLMPLDVNNGGTLKGALWLAAGARIVLSEGTPQNPSLTFDKDGTTDTGLYHIADGAFGVACNGVVTARFTADKGTIFDRPVQVPTPAAGDRSNNAASTAYVIDAIASASIGQIVFEVRSSVRAGCLKLDGALLNRADYPHLWAYAQASGALATEKDWAAGWWGCFSIGDGATTFRIPEFRGEGIRCADGGRGVDSGRGVGSWQDSQNRSHRHDASAGDGGDHVHPAWTDGQGAHSHPVNEPPHSHTASNGSLFLSGGVGTPARLAVDQNSNNWIAGQSTNAVKTGVSVGDGGMHSHSVGMDWAGRHSHAINVAADGGTEARMRNVAVLAMIRAY